MATRRGRRPAAAEAETFELEIEDVRRPGATADDYETVELVTDRGHIEMRYYPVPASTRAAIFVGGTGGGFDTPVNGSLYPRLCDELQGDGIACLRVRYRQPVHLEECTLDVLAGIHFLESEGAETLALCGHSFGGAVIIQAAVHAPVVRTCIPMSTQTFGADPATLLGPRCSMLIVHGTADEILPHSCSEYVHKIARQPKKLVLKEGARHGLDEWSQELPELLRDWITTELARATE